MEVQTLTEWIKSQRLKAPAMKGANVFYRNLEEALDVRRRDYAQLTLRVNTWRHGNGGLDFVSNDMLSLGASGQLRAEVDRELARYPDLPPGSGSSRLADGNYPYIQTVEAEMAEFHGAEAGVIVGSGSDGNVAIFAAIPRPGDVIVYDELVHASAHDGMSQGAATHRVSFRHNDPDSLQEVLMSICDSQPLIKQGKRCVLIAVESIYSMDGDVCPLKELVDVAKEACPLGNAQFIIDEAHSTGVLGPKGSGLVCALGLEKEIAVRLHTWGKALASTGAIILGNETVINALINFGRNMVYTTAPGFLMVAAGRAAYNLMRTGQTEAAQNRIRHLTTYFFKLFAAHPVLEKAADLGILDVPLSYDWEEQAFISPIVPIWTRQRYAFWLVFHMTLNQVCAFPVEYPTVPKGKSRVRVTFHAINTEEQVDRLVAVVAEWAQEMIDLEAAGNDRIPKAARKVYAWMGEQDISDQALAEHLLPKPITPLPVGIANGPERALY